ncbi:MAG: endonuclease/exonuclease/phosphatase family protein [Bacteroidales bacterium]|nr:endonuclease/exonuclease/phosphatase family protein [Bacteroidales bacterium]MDD4217363.1 endonuclease/exonuclease/phosphatase family protein [Bacteroidales bacterium]MDY0141264.1 endonuclease/exonuclease/phosphatase family protein [Bacteroidales bacterium]
MKQILLSLIFIFLTAAMFAQEKEYKVATIAFYNIENLFDTINDPDIYKNHEFTPESDKNWNTEKYFPKMDRIGEVIKGLGADVTGSAPAIVGLSEIENMTVLEDLVNAKPIKEYNYQIVHFDGPDYRGVDCALIYRPEYFKVTNTAMYSVNMDDPDWKTRDQLLVTGMFDGEEMSFIILHWPSRSGGEKRSAPKREAAADVTRYIVDSILNDNSNAKIVCMGDLNDDPINSSVKKHLRTAAKKENAVDGTLFNPMEQLYKKGVGSLAYRDNWNLFDQIVISPAFVDKENKGYIYYKTIVYNKPFLMQKEGKFKGYPFRTYVGDTYMGGYSDHFPVYIHVIKDK